MTGVPPAHQPDSLPMLGGCQCGNIRYQVWDAPETVYVCHCSECRRQSAAAFGISVIVRSETVRLVQGRPIQWTRRTVDGGSMACWFCPDCGTRLWHIAERDPDFRSIKGGSLDAPPDLSTVPHIHTDSKLAGVTIPEGVPSFPGEPPR